MRVRANARGNVGKQVERYRFFAEVADEFGVKLAYLFGSQTEPKGRQGPLSDYDFAVLFREKPSFHQRHELAYRLAQLLGVAFDRIDLVILNAAPIELRYGVVAAGILLYEADRAARVEFEAQTLGRYFDYLPVLRRQRAELLLERGHRREEKGDFPNAAGVQRYRAALRETERVLAQARAS